MRRDQYARSALYVGFGIGTLVVLFPWAIRHWGIWIAPFHAAVAGHAVSLAALRVLGGIAVAAGAAMYFSCAWDFNRRGQGTPAFWDPPRRLILNPWFRTTRNPMYLGVFLMNLGQALWSASLSILLYAVIVTAGFHFFVVAYEEPHLARVYGAGYREYCRRVPRWIPRVAPPRGSEQR